MFLLNSIISRLIPYIPKSLTYQFAKRYVAGVDMESTLEVIKRLNQKGYLATVDILGEHNAEIADANDITKQYINLYKAIDEKKLKCNISIKPSHIGADINEDIYKNNIKRILNISMKKNNFLRIDMESSEYTSMTIQSFKELKIKGNKLGTVFQAYLYRTYDDIVSLEKSNLNLRLCKGIYKESSEIAITDRNKINKNYLKILKYAFQNNIYVGIATHDSSLLDSIYMLIKEIKPSPDNFEFQTLYGVPMETWNNRHLKRGYKVRIYVPYGKDWYKYSVRRLKENPNIAGYVIKNLFFK